MTTLTEGRHPAEFLLSEANFHRSRDTITIASGSGKIEPGTLLGKVAIGGKYKPATATGSDGGETAVAVNLYGVDATSADVTVAAITRDAEVKAHALVYGSTVNDDTKKTAARGQLAAVGIISR
jgi:hypothetical protein